MTEFAGQAGGPGHEPPADHQGTADAVGQPHVEHVLGVGVACERFGQRREAGVVVHHHRCAEALGEGDVHVVARGGEPRAERAFRGVRGRRARMRPGDADPDPLQGPEVHAPRGAEAVDELEGGFHALRPPGAVVVGLTSGSQDLVGGVGDRHVHPPVPEVHAQELPGVGVQRELLGGPTASRPRRRIGVDHDDRAVSQQVTGDLRDGGAGQSHRTGDLTAAQRTPLAERAQHPLLVGVPHQRVRLAWQSHVGHARTAPFFRQGSDRIVLRSGTPSAELHERPHR